MRHDVEHLIFYARYVGMICALLSTLSVPNAGHRRMRRQNRPVLVVWGIAALKITFDALTTAPATFIDKYMPWLSS